MYVEAIATTINEKIETIVANIPSSTINIFNTSLPRAPVALNIPISFFLALMLFKD